MGPPRPLVGLEGIHSSCLLLTLSSLATPHHDIITSRELQTLQFPSMSPVYTLYSCNLCMDSFGFINLILQILSILFYFHRGCSGYVTSCRHLLNLSRLQDSVPCFARESPGRTHIHTLLHSSISGAHTPSSLYPATQMIHNNQAERLPHKTTVQ